MIGSTRPVLLDKHHSTSYGAQCALTGVGRQPRFPMFAESSLWKCEIFDANDSLRASLRTHTIGQSGHSGPENQLLGRPLSVGLLPFDWAS
jgi:hypothetical protein